MSCALAAPLEREDQVVQTAPFVSPTRWHLAHTSWFFETFLLAGFDPTYKPLREAYAVLFNSYYQAVGEQFPQARRGTQSRPTVPEVMAYRAHVDEALPALIRALDADALERALTLLELGLHHEQQHQELILTDIKHVFAHNPLRPAYREASHAPVRALAPMRWLPVEAGLTQLGAQGDAFSYDNELPRHTTYLPGAQLADRLVSCAEYLAFMEDGGYHRPELWLSDGWQCVQEQGWQAPLYWERYDSSWAHYTLAGMQPVRADTPVCHISLYEADAFARWAGARLPTEAEWEVMARAHPVTGNLLDLARLHPRPAQSHPGQPSQIFGDVWQWTSSPYVGYPGYQPAPGAVGEYNGKFMCNTWVLRGGSCATPPDHIRATYRNFFAPDTRWQFTGLRLARELT